MKMKRIILAALLANTAIIPAFSQSSGTMQNPATTSSSTTMSTDRFYTGTMSTGHWRASEAMGLTVYNNANENIGEVEELLVDGKGMVVAAVVSVGGFLGMGERNVAVNYSALKMTRDSSGKVRLVADFNKDNLKNAPEYNYEKMAK
jgi:sporulation protein YlmC with PRC-barrel domain